MIVILIRIPRVHLKTNSYSEIHFAQEMVKPVFFYLKMKHRAAS